MRADIRTVVIQPWAVYDVVVEITDGNYYQIYRVQWNYVHGQSIFADYDGGDPRRALGKALQELGRSLETSHGQKLVQPHLPPGCLDDSHKED